MITIQGRVAATPAEGATTPLRYGPMRSLGELSQHRVEVDVEPEELLESASLAELSMRRLRHEILSGALAPGERLIEEQLTQRFGISRAPLRSATHTRTAVT